MAKHEKKRKTDIPEGAIPEEKGQKGLCADCQEGLAPEERARIEMEFHADVADKRKMKTEKKENPFHAYA